ncbi:MAG TPA: 30S ribosomal protein S17 [Bacillota bacterium]|nr:30S ribosomal protein S17 [Bacillota bacterium]
MSESAVEARNNRKTMIGLVVSDKMDKTVIVAIERVVPHKLYGRRIRRTKRFKAHDENNQAHTGDRVEVMETRPLSRDKRWRVVRILQRAE